MSDPAPILDRIPPEIVAVADYEPFARERLTGQAWAYLAGGAADEITLRENRTAFESLKLRSRVLTGLSGVDLRVKLFGQVFEHPIFLAPVAYQKLAHPRGELETVLGASAMKAGMVLSTQSSVALEEVAAAARTPLWFQLYLQADWGWNGEMLRRAEAAGYQAIVLTVDAPVNGTRNREQRSGFRLPGGVEAVHWKGVAPGSANGGDLGALLASAPSWKDVERLQSLTRLPVLLKGIMSAEDADRAVDLGIKGIVVSNHGGRTLDTLPAAIDVLPEISGQVAGRVPLLLDGGIRRGTDVLKALALGASAVMVGRPAAFALAAAGAPGVAHVLGILKSELMAAMALTGRDSLRSLDPSVIWTRK